MKQKLKIDMDDTLCEFVTPWCEWLKDNGFTTKKLTSKEVSSYDYFSKQFGEDSKRFFLENPQETYGKMCTPIEGSKEFLDWCIQNFDVEILTHACKKETEEAKIKFCTKHYDFDRIKFISKLHDKYTLTNDSILIDDYPYHIYKHVIENKNIGIIFNHNYQYGWCTPSNYTKITKNYTVDDLCKTWVCSSYDFMKHILEQHMNNLHEE